MYRGPGGWNGATDVISMHSQGVMQPLWISSWGKWDSETHAILAAKPLKMDHHTAQCSVGKLRAPRYGISQINCNGRGRTQLYLGNPWRRSLKLRTAGTSCKRASVGTTSRNSSTDQVSIGSAHHGWCRVISLRSSPYTSDRDSVATTGTCRIRGSLRAGAWVVLQYCLLSTVRAVNMQGTYIVATRKGNRS